MTRRTKLAAFFALLGLLPSFAAAQGTAKSYQIISMTPNEIVVRVAPVYSTRVVKEAESGRNLTQITFPDGVALDSVGAPGTLKLVLPVLTPNRQPVSIEIVSQKLDIVPNVDLAPVPSMIRTSDGFDPVYHIDPARYASSTQTKLYDLSAADIFRTAFAERLILSPVQYNASMHSVTRLRELTLRIHIEGVTGSPVVTPASEQDLFKSVFLNGGYSQLYRSAQTAVTSALNRQAAFKASHAQSGGTWLQLETTAEGVYHISAQDLASAGIAGAIDPNSVELFGPGGEMLDENVTGSNGEWLERPIDVRSNGNALTDLYFYARSITSWKYAQQPATSIDGLFHRQNPYTSSGHFLLKIGGDRLGNGLRVRAGADTVTGAVISKDRVFTATLHEVDRFFEFPSAGRELLGEVIPRSDAGPLEFTLSAPGYTGDSTTIRVGYDAQVVDPAKASVAVSINGSTIASLLPNTLTSEEHNNSEIVQLKRSWSNATRVDPSISAPLAASLTFSSTDVSSLAWLDWIEFMYMRTTDVGATSIPFMVINSQQAFHYNFSNASGGAVWDVTVASDPRIVSGAGGNAIDVTLQGVGGSMRRFVAFSSQSVLSPHITSAAEPTLRATIGQTGTQEIIIAPQAFLSQANDLKQLREQGGQATEPLKVAVVTIEDIYREFGYGNKDITAIRDFLAYTFRHTTQNGVTVPLYVTLMGAGHSDYQNIVTNVPNWIPAWESPMSELVGTYRQSIFPPYPDDSYFVRLQPHSAQRELDMITGRLSVHNTTEAANYVAKVREYEHHSAEGDWRSTATFIADDRISDNPDQRDPLFHLEDTEAEIVKLPQRMFVNKIYEEKYPTVYTSEGRRKPSVEKAIVEAFNTGAVLISFVGHGNPNVWTHESILQVPSTINKFTNFDRLAFLTTATCDFSQYDNFEGIVSGGSQMLLKPDGAAIGLLGTSRSVTGGESLVWTFYQSLFGVDPDSPYGTNTVGAALMAGRLNCFSENLPFYYILGDPAQRLLVPKLYVAFDSINGTPMNGQPHNLAALSQVRLSGHIAHGSDLTAPGESNFTGNATITLYDAKAQQTASTFLPNDTIVDHYLIEGPILYRGTATVTDGRFSASFIVPKDIKFDTLSAKLSALAYSDDNRSALGATRDIRLNGSDSILSIIDTTGPDLGVYIGNRSFRSGDAVSMHSNVIVDVKDLHGLNTSTASIGHGFVAWVDDSSDASIDLAATFVAKQDDYTSGTSEHPIELAAGHHTLHVRAFDTFDNPSFASVDFVAKKSTPFQLYSVSNTPNPVADHTTFSFVQPGSAGSLVHVTLSLYSTDGRLTRRLVSETRASAVDMVWDAQDGQGNHVANGAYIYHVDAQNIDDGTSSQAEGLCIVSR